MKLNSSKVITRFPPSPTGPLHIGNVRTALFNYLFARHFDGKFIVRVEDTDKERSRKEYELDMLDGLKWMGLNYDGEIFHQSERGGIYKKALDELISKDLAYISKETEGENKEVVRFRNPNKKIAFDDLVRGKVEFDTTELGDFIIAKNLNEPLYHLAVVVDDFESGVTHVIRGEDHVSNTPRQILIQEAIGAPRPVYAHLPLILAKDRSKLSKRKHGESVSLKYYRDKGYLPSAVVNYLALLGWNPGTDKEIFSLDELIKEFSIEKIQKSGAIFDEVKLDWVNREHIKLLPKEEQIALIRKSKESEGYRDRDPELDLSKLNWKNTPPEITRKHLETVLKFIDDKQKIMEYAEKEGRGEVLWPLRYALTGEEKSPDPFTIIEVKGVRQSTSSVMSAIKSLDEEKK